jgi:hypothetical protein
MGVGTDSDLRVMEIIALAACQALMDKLDPDDPDQLLLINRLDEVCIMVQSDLEGHSS